MRKVKHSPGPWKACLNVPTALTPGHIIKTDNDVESPVALIPEGGGTHGKPRQLANAALIAAAPDLLKACKALNDWLTRLQELGVNISIGDAGDEGPVLEAASVAIAKSES